jgi:pyruvate dehydrogenase E2 component (dihydrolipoamide acetyltransferase)
MFTIVLARQGQTMENGTIMRWYKAPGEPFQIGDDLYDVESEKAVIAIQATRPGKIARLVVGGNQTVAVGALLAVAFDSNETADEAVIDAFVAKNTAGEKPADNGSAGVRPALSDPTARASRGVIAAPKARALAAELGIELAQVSGSGVEGAISVDDVRRAAASLATPPAGDDPRIVRRVPLTPIGRSIRSALERGARTPQFTQGILVDATALARRKAEHGNTLSYLDFFLDAIVRSAQAVPEVCARATERELEYFRGVDVSIATATDHGLLLPVLRSAGEFDLVTRAPIWRSLVERARAGRLAASEVGGGILSLSNLGTRGVDYGTPLLPADHSAIVFVGSIEPRAIVAEGRIEVRPSVHIAITYDHRVADGVLASRFTSALRSALEQPG